MLEIAICIPARNEADELPSLFAALETLEPVGGELVSVCLLLDACTDESIALTAAYRDRSRHRVVALAAKSTPANAGRARHHAVRIGLDALGGRDGLILTTDADCRPAPEWLRSMTHALQHADIVAGRVIRSESSSCHLQDRIEAYYDRLFALRRRLDPVPWEAVVTHHHTGGANLGMTAAAYRTAGGFLPLPSGEDARFVDDAARAGLRVRRDAACLVRTSDRREGRASGGLAETLLRLDDAAPDTVRVSHPEDAAWQYAMHALARRTYVEDRLELVATALGLTRDHAASVARDAPNAEAFALRIVPVPPNGMREISLPMAEAALHRLITTRKAA